MVSAHASDQETLDLLRRGSDDPRRRVLVKGGTIVSMDARVGDLLRGDVLVEGRRIAAVDHDLSAAAGNAATTVVDASGMVVIPGLQDTHRHCWQSQLRRLIAGADLDRYIETVHTAIGPHYRPEDIYAGNLIAALGALDAGVTCVLDFSHNSRSTAHSDAAIQGFVDAGVRTVHASGPPLVGEWDWQWPDDLGRLRSQYCSDQDSLVTLRMAVYGSPDLGGPERALTADTIRFARELGVEIIADAVFGPEVSARIEELGRAGLLGPDVTLIHCNAISDEAWRHIADSGTNVSLCSTSDPQVGCVGSIPPIQQALDFGVQPGLSVDVECCVSTSMFAQMQAAYTIQRMDAFSRRFQGDQTAPPAIGVRDTLLMATAYGAAVNGVAERVGTLTPGKEADLVLIDAEDWNTTPLNNAVGTVVLGADTRNVDTVLIGGEVRKWRGEIVDQDRAAIRHLVAESRDRVLATSGYALDVLG